MRILLVEDNPGDAFLIHEFLKESLINSHYELKEVKRLNHAIEIIKKELFDIVLLDLGLPDSTGIETFQKLYKEKSSIPIIITTGLEDESASIRAVSYGAQDYLVKGNINSYLLRKSIRYAIERKKTEENVFRLNKLYNFLSHANQAITYNHNREELFQRICDVAVNVGEFDLAFISLMDEKTSNMKLVTYKAKNETESETIDFQIGDLLPTFSPSNKAIHSKSIYYSNNVLKDHEIESWHQVPSMMGVNSICSVPIRLREQTIGTFSVYTSVMDYFNDKELQLLNDLGTDISYALEYIENELEKNKAREDLINSEYRFRTLYEHSPVPTLVEDFSSVKQFIDNIKTEGETDLRLYFEGKIKRLKQCASLIKIIDLNKESLNFFDIKRKDEIIDNIQDFYLKESWDVIKEQIIAISEGKDTFESEMVIRDNKGNRKIIQLRLSVVPEYEANMERVLLSFIDITKIKQIEMQLLESNERLSLAAELSELGIWDWDVAMDKAVWDVRMCDIYGIPAGTIMTYEEWATRIHPEDLPGVEESMKKSIAKKESTSMEYRIICPDGSMKYISDAFSVILNCNKEIERMIGVNVDITERKKAEEALKEGEEIFNQFMKYSPFYVFFLDEINRPIRLSDNFSKLIDWSPEEIVGKNLDEIFPEELTKILIADNPKMLNEGVSITGEFIYNDRKYSIIKFPILFEEIPQLISGFIIDITEQNEAVSAMQETRDRYQALFNRSLDYVYIHDLNGVIIDVNQPFLSKLGYEKDEIINKNISSFLFDDQNLQTMLRDIENIKKDGYLRKASEYKLKGKNDLLIDVETNASLIYSEGKPVAIQGIARDITDRIKAVGC